MDLLKLNGEELHFISGRESIEEGARWVLERGVDLVVVTLDADGCYFANRVCQGMTAGWPVRAIDTTGAGDAFTAGLLTALLEERDAAADWASLPADILGNICRFANAAAAISTTRLGAIPSLPPRDEVTLFLHEMSSQK